MYVSDSVRFSFGTIRTNVRNFFLIFLCNCKIKFYICITKTSLSYGVMVTQQILVLLFLVRIQVAQHRKPAAFRLRVFRFQPSAPPLPHLNAGLPARRSPPVKEPPGFPQKRPPGSPHQRAARIGHVPPLTGTRKSEESYRPQHDSAVRRTTPSGETAFSRTLPDRQTRIDKTNQFPGKKGQKKRGNDPF